MSRKNSKRKRHVRKSSPSPSFALQSSASLIDASNWDKVVGRQLIGGISSFASTFHWDKHTYRYNGYCRNSGRESIEGTSATRKLNGKTKCCWLKGKTMLQDMLGKCTIPRWLIFYFLAISCTHIPFGMSLRFLKDFNKFKFKHLHTHPNTLTHINLFEEWYCHQQYVFYLFTWLPREQVVKPQEVEFHEVQLWPYLPLNSSGRCRLSEIEVEVPSWVGGWVRSRLNGRTWNSIVRLREFQSWNWVSCMLNVYFEAEVGVPSRLTLIEIRFKCILIIGKSTLK